MFLRWRDCNDIITIQAIETALIFLNLFGIDVVFTATFLAETYHDETLAIFHNQIKRLAKDAL
jgi:hypothetical protein